MTSNYIIQMSHSKIRDIRYPEFKLQPYLKSQLITQDRKGLLFVLHSSMVINIKQNFSSLYQQNLGCKMNCEDPNAIDSQPHMLQCEELAKFLSSDKVMRAKCVKY